jgi:hypothetical protein
VRVRALLACAVVVAGALLAPRGWARQEERDDAWSVPTVFFVAKSENKNQVHYGIHLDDRCAPVGGSPVYAYWRMLEHGPSAYEPLLPREVRAYGIAEQRVLESGSLASRTRVTLEALRARPMIVETYSDGTRCVARAVLPMAGAPAVLGNVFVQLRWPFGVAFLLLSGHSLGDGGVVREQVEP